MILKEKDCVNDSSVTISWASKNLKDCRILHDTESSVQLTTEILELLGHKIQHTQGQTSSLYWCKFDSFLFTSL